MGTAMRSWALTPAVAVVSLLLDWLSKWWAKSSLAEGSVSDLLPGLINLNLTSNTGGAFGLLREYPVFMTVLPAALSLVIALWVVHRERSVEPPNAVERSGWGFILGGALGNIADRLADGRVTDFLEFAFISFPVFNVADVLIDAGVVLLLANTFMQDKLRQSTEEQECGITAGEGEHSHGS